MPSCPVVVQGARLEVWETDPRLPPRGIHRRPNYPVSYALVELTWENRTLAPQTVTLQRIELQADGQVVRSWSTPTTVALKPLEIAPWVGEIASQEPYPPAQTFVAVVTYTVGDQTCHLHIQAPVD